MQKPILPKGTRDFNSEELYKRNYIINIIRDNFSKFGLRIYVCCTFLGFLFNILSNFSYLNKIIYLLTVTEHMIIGSILTFTYFSKIKTKFK